MSQGKRFYDESEVSEILKLAGKQASSSNTFSWSDLEKAAAELDISGDVVAKAIRRMLVGKQDAADRREFRRKKLRPMLFYFPPLLVLMGLLTVRDPFLLSNLLMVIAGMVMGVQQVMSRPSWIYEKEFHAWRSQRVLRLAPDLFQDLVDPVLDRYFSSFTGIAPVHSVATRIVVEFDMPFEAAMESARSFLSRRPDLATRVDLSTRPEQYAL